MKMPKISLFIDLPICIILITFFLISATSAYGIDLFEKVSAIVESDAFITEYYSIGLETRKLPQSYKQQPYNFSVMLGDLKNYRSNLIKLKRKLELSKSKILFAGDGNMRLPFAEKEMANIEQKLNSLIDNLEQVMKYNDPSIFKTKLIEEFERTVEHETSYLSPEIWHASTGCSIWSKNKDQFYGDLIVDQLLSHLFESGPCNNCQGEDKFYLAYKDRQKEKRFIYTYEYNNRLSACVNFKSCTDFQTSSLLTKFYPNKFFQAVWVGIHQEKFYAFQSQLLAIKFDQQADLKSFWSSAEERLKIKSEMEQGLSNLIRRIWFNEGGQNYYSYVMVKNNTIVILDPSTLYWEKWGNNKRILRILNNYF